MKQITHPGFEQQFKRAALFFPDSQWLYNQVISTTNVEEPESEQITEAEKEIADIPVVKLVTTNVEKPESEQITEAEKEIADIPVVELVTTNVEEPKSENEDVQESFHEVEDIAREEPNSRLSELLASQAATFNAPVEKDAVLTITTEALHTIDYFASQGINIEISEDNPLGKKVKKFTDWLKQMKRISANPDNLGTTEAEEKAVIKSAEISNKKKEILTEAMADILIQQGKKKQAIEVLEKLSLLNPRKSAYFAAQINNLKGK
jgi:predicted Zn-dependent protease